MKAVNQHGPTNRVGLADLVQPRKVIARSINPIVGGNVMRWKHYKLALLKHRGLVSLMGHLLPIVGSVGFLLAWLALLITMGTV